MGSYVPSTDLERQEMLSTFGLHSVKELFEDIPQQVRLKKELCLPEGMSELEVHRNMMGLANKNKVFTSIFRGAGAYRHFIPAIVKSVISKESLLTAYTPYQPEISQGILQSIFEYQTMICDLTGMDASNASVYDGATAAAESIMMCQERKRSKVFISKTVNPFVLDTVHTYCFGKNIELIIVPEKNGVTDISFIEKKIDSSTACVYIQQPNFYGSFEDGEKIGEVTHSAGAKFIMGVNPISLGIAKTPREYSADIAVGEGQPLGIPLSFGGPYLGFMATVDAMKRKLPGRIVGQTKDSNGKIGYVLTLQAREQHIRREKSSSNICSNEALCALAAGVYLSAMGKKGIREVAVQSMSKADYLAERLSELGFKLVNKEEFFNEFVTESPKPVSEVMRLLESKGILGGYPLREENKGKILWCCTEMNSKKDIDELIAILQEV